MTSRTAGRWSDAIAYRVRERDALRQIRYNRLRKASARALAPRGESHLRDAAIEFVTMLGTALLGFWVIGTLLEATLHVNPLYTFALAGAAYSLQATYHKHRLARDPSYKIPRCWCARRQDDAMEEVLTSRQSTILRVPISMLGALFYCSVAALTHFGDAGALVPLATCAVAANSYLGYVMVRRIGGLCPDCVNVAALNVLILAQVLV